MEIYHESKYIELHNETIEIDINMIELITKLNKDKLITRGCCENWQNSGQAYIIFEYNCFIELIELKNDNISRFINDSNKSEVYYANNNLRHIKYNNIDYKEKFKNETEIWICVTFPTTLIQNFVNVIN